MLPQRGQSVFRPAQVVPQLEQVQQPLTGDVVPQVWQVCPTAPETVPVLVQEPLPQAGTSSKAQDDCGNSGREKNSSYIGCCLYFLGIDTEGEYVDFKVVGGSLVAEAALGFVVDDG